ncbi:T-cell surface protein tactile isoform X1 [Gopherus flavomarginatus]|uniref:T-cell surface protein tactile isoform X1 n=1 Tax=Gopherus flavomarginatus TaxID=286002 RepID=UPI0021CBA5DA|nr:T-cell surface protein tactile isoform X1 [Gopherus flavomarginatus]
MKMEKRWPPCALYLFILTHRVAGQLEGTIINTEAVRAFPGSDVTLECSILSADWIHLTQTQWSKIDDTPPSRIAVYNPIYGITYLPFSKTSYNYSVAFSKTPRQCWVDVNKTWSSHDAGANQVKCQRWSLHLRNVSLSLSGQYECSFATYPYGTKAAEINLTIKAEDEKHYRFVEMLLNETLEIPCLENMTSVNLSKYPLKWLMGENGREETTLIIKEFYQQDVNKTNSLLYKERIQLGPDNALKISPIKIVDDGKVFSCRVMYHPERILMNIIKVKVFAKPEISITLQNNSRGSIGEASLTCIVKKAFPKPSLTWYVDGEIFKDQFGGISIEAENLKDGEGFYELRSILKIQSTNQSDTNQTFWCMCSFPFQGNKRWNISSGEIIISSGHVYNKGPFPDFTTTATKDPEISTFPSIIMATTGLQTTSSTSLDFTSPVTSESVSTARSQFDSPTDTQGYTNTIATSESETSQRLSDPTTATQQSNVNTTLSRENVTLPHCNLSSSTMVDPALFTKFDGLSTTRKLVNGTGMVGNAENARFSWPAVVALLLLFCSFLIILGIRKWCQYQKEIMNRPPSFKPPPPPIKYTSMLESDGTTPSCHELETL